MQIHYIVDLREEISGLLYLRVITQNSFIFWLFTIVGTVVPGFCVVVVDGVMTDDVTLGKADEASTLMVVLDTDDWDVLGVGRMMNPELEFELSWFKK